MSTHNIYLYKEVKEKYTGSNLKTTEFLDCALIGVCALIRSNTVCPVMTLTILYSINFIYMYYVETVMG